MRVWLLLILACWLGLPLRAGAHEFRPAMLRLNELTPSVFHGQWIEGSPGSEGSETMGPHQLLPAHCSVGPGRSNFRVECGPTGLVGELGVEGDFEAAAEVFLRIHWADGRRASWLLRSGHPTVVLEQEGEPPGSFLSYLALGMEHIGTGWDHLAFVLMFVLLTQIRTCFGATKRVTTRVATRVVRLRIFALREERF